jgi:hypothetical protein
VLDLEAVVLDVVQAASWAMTRVSSLRIPSWSQRPPAPAATVALATSGDVLGAAEPVDLVDALDTWSRKPARHAVPLTAGGVVSPSQVLHPCHLRAGVTFPEWVGM